MKKNVMQKQTALAELDESMVQPLSPASQSLENLKRQTGQMTLEMILLMVVILSLAISATKYIQDNEIMASFIGGPWKVVQGMIEDGVWVKQGPSKAQHPNLVVRHLTPEGDRF